MKNSFFKTSLLLFSLSCWAFSNEKPVYTIVDTGQNNYYDNQSYSSKPQMNDAFFGQDASYLGFQANYTNNGDGTTTDNNTQLIWQKLISEKLTWKQAVESANNSNLAGFNDWRIPTIKELYSLMNFSGVTGTSKNKDTTVPYNAKPYINTKYFDFEYSKENRYIDAQYWTKTDYVSTTMNGAKTFFGVNFADGRIKGYPKYSKGGFGRSKFYLRLVRGNENYGKNDFIDNNDGTIYDEATQLTWMKSDSGSEQFNALGLSGALNWEKALLFCENLNYANSDTWRLPNAKELQSIVDYTRSPNTTSSAAINELFNATSIINANALTDYPFYWTSTTHLDGFQMGNSAVYIAFGRALGYMRDRRTGSRNLLDVHGAGAQRSDPKSGDASRFQYGRGPQGDVIAINNYVRCVKDNYTIINENDYEKVKVSSQNNRPPRFENENREGNGNFQESSNQNSSSSKRSHPVLNRFDTNKDNKISYEEAPGKMKENFKRHDMNGNGYIEDEELSSLPGPRR